MFYGAMYYRLDILNWIENSAEFDECSVRFADLRKNVTLAKCCFGEEAPCESMICKFFSCVKRVILEGKLCTGA